MRRVWLGSGLALGAFLAAAATANEAAAPDRAGRDLYQQRCAACHDANGFGTRVLSRRVPEGQAMLEKREALPAPYVTTVVRRGIGSMPAIRDAELGDVELALIARYLEGSE